MRLLVEWLSRLPAELFYGAMAGGFFVAVVGAVAGIVLLARKKKGAGALALALAAASALIGLVLLFSLMADIVCTGRNGDWIC